MTPHPELRLLVVELALARRLDGREAGPIGDAEDHLLQGVPVVPPVHQRGRVLCHSWGTFWGLLCVTHGQPHTATGSLVCGHELLHSE